MTAPESPSSSTPVLELCHCGHTDEQHDVVAARYCRATLAGVLRRGCACPTGDTGTARSYDRR